MKKKVLLLLIPLLISGLSGCVKYNGKGKPGKSSTPSSASVAPSSDESSNPSSSSSSSSSVTPPDPAPHGQGDDADEGAKITIYLVYGQYALLDGQPVNDNVESLFLEHAQKVEEAVVGSDLPGKDRVTSVVEKSKFKTWAMYKNDGKLTEYTKVPAIKNAILYAIFEGGKGGEQSGGGSTLPTEYTPATAAEGSSTGVYGFKFSDNTYMAGVYAEEFDGFQQFKITARSFKKDQEFTLWDFDNNAGWTVPVDPYSFNGSSAQDTNWTKYLDNNGSRYKVLQDFNAADIYIKIKMGQDQVYFKLGLEPAKE